MPIQNFITVDEVGLLPGATESTAVSGVLDIDYSQSLGPIQFAPLLDQALSELNLTSNSKPLYYTFENNEHDLVAKAGANGELIFKASVSDEGTFNFTLYQQLDREIPQNLISDEVVKYKVNHDFGNHLESGIAYQLETEPNHPYQVSFYYAPHDGINPNIDIYWGNEHLYTLTSLSARTGFNFPLFGGLGTNTDLKFFTQDNVPLDSFLQNVQLIDSAQNKLSLPFQFNFNNETTSFTVNVTTDIPIISAEEHFNIVYDDQIAYQNIIVQGSQGQESLTKINLDSIFESMKISPEHRQVEVVQRESTNDYSVHIFDASDTIQSPITVADVRLSIEGEDSGLDSFFRHIQFDL